MKRQLLVLIACFLAILGMSSAHAEDPAIFWDEAGNIHLFTNSEAELNFAWGWAQMRDNTKLLLDVIAKEEPVASAMPFDMDEEQYQLFADGMTGFLNRRLDTLSLEHQALLPLESRDVLRLQKAALGEWRIIFLHHPEFQKAGTGQLGVPKIVIDKKVEAVDRAVLMEDFRMLELLAPLSQNE